MASTETPKTERLEDWCEDLIEAIKRRAAITYSLNELSKVNVKTYFTEAAKDYLREQQLFCNRTIQSTVFLLVNGHKQGGNKEP